MNTQVLDKSENNISFLFKGIDPVVANTLRRLIVNEVPTLAIEDVEIVKNNSALYDETIAHRLGLIPIRTDLKSYTLPSECKCEGKGCENCQLKLILKAKGPCTVYSSELKSQDPKAKPVIPNIPIAKLLEGQELVIEAVAILGKGVDHMKFSPGLAFYRGYPEFIIKQDSNLKAFAEKAPKGLCKVEGRKLEINDVLKWNEACFDLAKENNIEVKFSEEDYIFEIESWGQLTVKEILLNAVKTFDDKLDEFLKLLKKIKETE